MFLVQNCFLSCFLLLFLALRNSFFSLFSLYMHFSTLLFLFLPAFSPFYFLRSREILRIYSLVIFVSGYQVLRIVLYTPSFNIKVIISRSIPLSMCKPNAGETIRWVVGSMATRRFLPSTTGKDGAGKLGSRSTPD